jgi:hypothetical protein
VRAQLDDGRRVVAHAVASVVGKPEDPGVGLPVEADRVANAAREDLAAAAVGLHAQDARVGLGRVADVARRAHGNAEEPVGAEGDVLPAVIALPGKPIGARLGAARDRAARGIPAGEARSAAINTASDAGAGNRGRMRVS